MFGLLGLLSVSEAKSPLLQLDYTLSVVDVYCNAVRHSIQNDASDLQDILEMIVGASTGPDDLFPSQVPRWDISL